ncbi:MAG: 50S ribosomal protein L23 [Leptospiraceae bacterium]|nr:50S ribosomal protein L23 [Leptospiraceae bacterium]
MNIENVIIAPLLTEKAQDLEKIGEKTGKRTVKYSFRVHPRANKTLVKESIRKTYNVAPTSINIMVYKGKEKKFRNSIAVRPHWKKAVVTFANGAVLDFTKGA